MRVIHLLLLAICGGLFLTGSLPAVAQGAIYGAADLGPAEGPPAPGAPGGTVTFSDLGTPGTRITAVVTGASPGSRYVVEIQDGACTGPLLHLVGQVTIDAAGMGQVSTDVAGHVDFTRWYATVQEVTSPPSPVASCGAVHPALAGAPRPVAPRPGMPQTGQGLPGPFLAVGLTLAGLAGLARLAGLLLRRGSRAVR